MMNKSSGMVLGCVVGMALALGLVSTVQANLITNGDMELGGGASIPPTGWYNGGGRISVSTDTPSGTGHSLEVYDNAGGALNGAAYQVGIAVEPGVYQLSFSYKGDSPRWWLATSDYVGISADNLSASSGWTNYSTSVTVPSGVTSAMLFLYAVPKYGFVTFDNVALVPEPCTIVMLCLGGLMLHRKKFGLKS